MLKKEPDSECVVEVLQHPKGMVSKAIFSLKFCTTTAPSRRVSSVFGGNREAKTIALRGEARFFIEDRDTFQGYQPSSPNAALRTRAMVEPG